MPSITRKSQNSSRADRRAQMVERLLEVVERFLKEGETFTELSVERLVQEAGLSRSTFYVYFEDKGDLLRALTEDVIIEINNAARIWWELPPSATKDEVRAGIGELMDAYVKHELLMGAVVETAAYDEGVREGYQQMIDMSVANVTKHLQEGQKDGFVHTELDPSPVAKWSTLMTERGLYQLVRGAPKAGRDKLLDALTDIVWNTFYEGTR